MDTTTITHLSLCSGYGGIDLGLRRAIGESLRTVAYAEIEAFACELLLARMEGRQIDAAPIWPDLKSFPWASFRDRVDILSGGYPCQPFSAAGKRLGKDDPRHLWPYIADGIRILRPRLCFFENVEGHISLGLRDVIEELERLGYSATWGIFSASEVGAPHQRKRVFILAISNSLGGVAEFSGSLAWNEGLAGVADHNCDQAWPSRPGEPQHAWEPPRVVANANGGGNYRPEQKSADLPPEPSGCCGEIVGDSASRKDDGRGSRDVGEEAGTGRGGNDAADGSGEGVGDATFLRTQGQWPEQQAAGAMQSGCAGAISNQGNWQTEPTLGRDLDGSSGGLDYAELCISCDNRTDELRLLGNGVVPATAERAFLTLLHQLLCPSTSR